MDKKTLNKGISLAPGLLIKEEMGPLAVHFNRIDLSPLLRQREIHPRFQRRELRKFKIDLLEKLPSLKISENSRSYYLHQISQVHELDHLVLLVQEINQRLEGMPV